MGPRDVFTRIAVGFISASSRAPNNPRVRSLAEEEALEVERIQTRLAALLSGGQAVGVRPSQPRDVRPRTLRVQPPSVRIANQDSDFYTIIDVSTNDRPALLFDITRTLSDLGLEIVMSRAATRADRITDAFYVTDRGRKVAGEERHREIEERLLHAIQRGRD